MGDVELRGVDLGDVRRTKRLIRVAATMATRSMGTITGSFDTWAGAKGAYRLLECEHTTHEAVCEPHFQQTEELMRESGVYLAIEDTSALEFNSRNACSGLGPIGEHFTQGLWMHSTLVARVGDQSSVNGRLSVEVIGLLDQQLWARKRTKRKGESKAKRQSRPRESQRWAQVFEKISPAPNSAQWIYVADRESDLYEIFERCKRGNASFVIRAAQPRALVGEDRNLFEVVASQDVRAVRTIDIPARAGQRARSAEIELRTASVVLRGPVRPSGRLSEQSVRVVEVRERPSPSVKNPICWVLLTDLPLDTVEQAWRVRDIYQCRWLIEEFHKVNKTGLRVEESQLSTAIRLMALAGILSIVAVHLLNLKLVARHRSQEPVEAGVIDPVMLAILENRHRRPRGGWTYGPLFIAIAKMGGFMGRKSDGWPGWLTIWRGWTRLVEQVIGYELARSKTCG